MPPGSVAKWLSEIGLTQYIDLFEREQIGVDLLATLTDADLLQLGLPFGPRKRFLTAAVALAATSSRSLDASSQPQAERRQLTVRP